MKRFPYLCLAGLVVLLLIVAPTDARADYEGLWVGTATLKYVSEVNKQYADLTFDMGLIGVTDQQTMIPAGAEWRYADTPAAGWTGSDTAFEDSAWTAGDASIGFGGEEVTTAPTTAAVYFRKHFFVEDPAAYTELRVKVWRDDGVVLYLNSAEIFRNNLPSGEFDPNEPDTYALSEINANTEIEFTLPAGRLQAGDNLLAAEVRTNSETGDDLLFDLMLTATAHTGLIPLEADSGDPWADVWRVFDSGEPDPLWNGIGFDDGTWGSGTGPFGYGDNPDKTPVEDGTPAVYFRKTFSGAGDADRLRVLLAADDGAVVYVNGVEILRSNMPDGPIDINTPPLTALGAADEGRYRVFAVDPGSVPGLVLDTGADPNNVAAVEVHQHPAELGGAGVGASGALTRTAAPLELRLLFHAGVGGAPVRLLKEVIQMYNTETRSYDLLTDHTRIAEVQYTGVALRDGVPVGRRLSAVGFDFPGSTLTCSGGVSSSGSVGCVIDLESDHPTNPYLHRFHPDHDNLDERYDNPAAEAFVVTRSITLDFDPRFPPDTDLEKRDVTPAGWGHTILGGYYEETLTGLHKETISVRGPFVLRRVVATETLTE
jgi:hypothetical protein